MTPSILIKHVNIIPMPGPRVLRDYNVIVEEARVKKIFPSRDQKNEKFVSVQVRLAQMLDVNRRVCCELTGV